jgi:hypothetical protein
MTAYSELRETGRLGEEGVTELYRAVRITAVSHNFPPPPGSERWDETAVTDVTHDFLTGPRGLARMTELAARADDERSFARLLDTAVLNHLRDVARRTDRGRLIRRIKEVMSDDALFKRAPQGQDWWQLTAGASEASSLSLTAISPHLLEVEVTVPRWTSEERNAPVADRRSLTDLLSAALVAAGGALTDENLAELVARRVDTRHSPLTVELETLEGVSEPAAIEPSPGDAVIEHAEATAIFNNLSDVARIVLTVADQPVREIALVSGVGKSQAATYRQRLFEDLRNTLRGSEDAAAVLKDLTMLCELWLQSRTTGNGATSASKRVDEGGD